MKSGTSLFACMWRLTFFAGLFFIFVAPAHALEPSACYDAKFTVAFSLSDFPSKMPSGLKDLTKDISDRNGPFNAGDVGGGPFKRFSMAAFSKECILVAIEYGGRGHGASLWYFVADGSNWIQSERIPYIGEPTPSSLKGFLNGARYTFSAMYKNGNYVPRSDREAAKWQLKASEK